MSRKGYTKVSAEFRGRVVGWVKDYNVSIGDAAVMAGVARGTVYDWLRAAGVQIPPTREIVPVVPPVEKLGRAPIEAPAPAPAPHIRRPRLTIREKSAILDRLRAGETVAEVSASTGLGDGTLRSWFRENLDPRERCLARARRAIRAAGLSASED